jgi:hypothetical protein
MGEPQHETELDHLLARAEALNATIDIKDKVRELILLAHDDGFEKGLSLDTLNGE